MGTSIRALVLGLVCAALAACSANPRPTAENTPGGTTVRVVNQDFSDMTIYVLQGGQRIRLGLVTGNSTAIFPIPDYLVGKATTLRFLADPIGSRRTPVSDEISVQPGDQVTLTIPPSGG